MPKTKPRILVFDNLTAVLITLVVFAHLLEPILYGKTKSIYLFVYLFHMPLFVFCSGFFAQNRPTRVLTNMLYPFAIFQILYTLFNQLVLGKNTLLQFGVPYWILWYLIAMAIWMLLVPLIEKLGSTPPSEKMLLSPLAFPF